MTTDPIKDLSRTKAAIEAYDAHDKTWREGFTLFQAKVWFEEKDRLAKAVGIAYGHDTADRNSMDTCEHCVRPGFKSKYGGDGDSFVRRMVKQWEERCQNTPSKEEDETLEATE